MDLQVVQLSKLSVQLVTGCCGEPFPDVEVEIDGNMRGCTDSKGSWTFVAPVGTHSFDFVFRPDDTSCGARMSREVTVLVGHSNDFVFHADTYLSIYCTD